MLQTIVEIQPNAADRNTRKCISRGGLGGSSASILHLSVQQEHRVPLQRSSDAVLDDSHRNGIRGEAAPKSRHQMREAGPRVRLGREGTTRTMRCIARRNESDAVHQVLRATAAG